jgi:hypothetical protein
MELDIGIVGCGTIGSVYLKNCTALYENLKIPALADLVSERACERATELNGVYALSLQGLFDADDINIVLNLTLPKAHYEVSRTLSLSEWAALVSFAESKGLCFDSAPYTALGTGIQSCRKYIDDGDRPPHDRFRLCRRNEPRAHRSLWQRGHSRRSRFEHLQRAHPPPPPEGGADLALHAFELMEAFHRSADTGKHCSMRHSCERPAPRERSAN